MQRQIFKSFLSRSRLIQNECLVPTKNVPLSEAIYDNLTFKYDEMLEHSTLFQRKHWIQRMASEISPQDGTQLLDMAGGQGAFTFGFLDVVQSRGTRGCVSHVCDISENMMISGKTKARTLGHEDDAVRWVRGDVHHVPFEDGVFDACVLSFGIRKINLERVFDEAYRVLKPGGKFFVLDMAKPENPLMSWLFWNVYMEHLVPYRVGFTQTSINQYRSVLDDLRSIPLAKHMISLFESAGFNHVKHTPLTMGIGAYYGGLK